MARGSVAPPPEGSITADKAVPGLRYKVVTKSRDGTFRVGDDITFAPDGTINCAQAQGWIDASDAPKAVRGMHMVPNVEWARRQVALLHSKANALAAAYGLDDPAADEQSAVAAAVLAGRPVELSAERIDAIAETVIKAMPDGIRGFMATWGWRQFATALLEVCAGHVAAARGAK